MSDTSLALYRTLETTEHRNMFCQTVINKGYSAFYALIEDLRHLIRNYQDTELAEIDRLLKQCREDFPDPASFSPSWADLWDEFDLIYRAKNEVLADFAETERNGEWQVLIDNPYLPHQVVCYPALTFLDAAYKFAYFQKDLKPNENLRLQRIAHLRIKSGNNTVSMLPDT